MSWFVARVEFDWGDYMGFRVRSRDKNKQCDRCR